MTSSKSFTLCIIDKGTKIEFFVCEIDVYTMSLLDSLTPEQRKAYDLVEEGKSIFLTGPGGTGKSFLLKTMYEMIPDRKGKHVAVTAMTGCAALLIGRFAKTLHSWAGIGLGRESAPTLAALIRRSGKALRRWLGTDILIIDEVSMLTPELLEKLDEVAKLVRRNSLPMGGIQVVFVGDFYQLPPVLKEGDISFVFECPLWKEIVQETVCLTQILRQTDPVFHKILDETRKGRISRKTFEILENKKKDTSWQTMNIKPTLLYTRRVAVDRVNQENLKALPGDCVPFFAETIFEPIDKTMGLTKQSPEIQFTIEKMDKDGPYMAKLYLKKNAQVMLIYNIDQEAGLVNGSRGVIEDFDIEGNPIVKFLNGTSKIIEKVSWFSQDFPGVGRKQIPLKLAYAITIHKAQGATLDCALIDIGTSTFECGQAYVALSRVKNLDSLYVWNVEPTAFRAHPKVKEFYQNL
jgi:ATP-dependent DNA helicase PIF1